MRGSPANDAAEKTGSEYVFQYLRLLAEPSQPEHTNPDALILPRAGRAHCFTQLAEAADQIVATTTFRPG